MYLARCPHGHFYDKEKFDSCPHCDSQDNYRLVNKFYDKECKETVFFQ